MVIKCDRVQIIPFVEGGLNLFYSEDTNMTDKHTPMKTTTVKGHLPWISSLCKTKTRDAKSNNYHSSLSQVKPQSP